MTLRSGKPSAVENRSNVNREYSIICSERYGLKMEGLGIVLINFPYLYCGLLNLFMTS